MLVAKSWGSITIRAGLLFLSLLLIAFVPLVHADTEETPQEAHQKFRDKFYNHCDVVVHCVTDKVLQISFGEEIKRKNESFMFALKEGELVVPKKLSPLGDGTLNYKITQGGCDRETKVLEKGWFVAKMWDERWVEYRDGFMYGLNASGDSVLYETVIWYAQCEIFE